MPQRSEEIQREDWVPFLDDFSREHQGWEVDLEVSGPEEGGRIAARQVPLEGIWADLHHGVEHISIRVGEERDPRLTHVISQARRLRVEKTEAGNDAALEIQSAAGFTTVLKLHQVPRAA